MAFGMDGDRETKRWCPRCPECSEVTLLRVSACLWSSACFGLSLCRTPEKVLDL